MRRIKYNKADMNDTMRAARLVAARGNHAAYIVPTYLGYDITTRKPPTFQRHIVVQPSGEAQEAA